MDKYVHPGQMVTTIFMEDGSVFLWSGHPPEELATWTAAQIVEAAQKSNRGI